MSARYKEIERAEVEALEYHKKMQPQFNTTKPLEKYFHKAIEIIFSGRLADATLRGLGIHPNIRKINDFYWSLKKQTTQDEIEKCKNVFLHLYKVKAFKLLEDEEMMKHLTYAMTKSSFWVREFNTWEKPSHNIHKQFSSILRQMFAKYPIPLFLDKAWIEYGSDTHVNWFIHIGSGKSIRELKNFPIPMTKKMAHEFLNTPDEYDINSAIRRAQVLSMGGSEWLAWHIGRGRLGQGHYGDNEFWSTVIKFFCNAPMFDCEHIPQIIDYISALKTAMTRIEVEPGLFRPVLANPNFSMKGRTLDALIRDSEAWHNRIANETKHTKSTSSWPSTKIMAFHLTEGSTEKGTAKMYNIKELLSADELIFEGRRMHNCVSSYAHSCMNGRCSIWSLRVNTQYHSIEQSLVTIELLNQSKTIVQVRALSNSKPGNKERSIVEKWANKAGLRIAGSAFGGW